MEATATFDAAANHGLSDNRFLDRFDPDKIAQPEQGAVADGCLVGKAVPCRFRKKHPSRNLEMNAHGIDYRYTSIITTRPRGRYTFQRKKPTLRSTCMVQTTMARWIPGMASYWSTFEVGGCVFQSAIVNAAA